MDTRAKQPSEIDTRLDEIKRHMPMTYGAIKEKAAVIGPTAFRHVRQGVAGQPNRFFAVESDPSGEFRRLAGTPFTMIKGMDQVADLIRQFGDRLVIIWADEAQATPAEPVEA
jgi:hypothetical protein